MQNEDGAGVMQDSDGDQGGELTLDTGPVYEIEMGLDSEEPATEGLAQEPTGEAGAESGSRATMAPADSDPQLPPPVAAAEPPQRVEQLEGQLSQLTGLVTELVKGSSPTGTPAPNAEELASHLLQNPNASMEDLVQYVRATEGRVKQQAAEEARRLATAERAKIRFSADAMGQGNDFDTLVSTYVEPLARENQNFEQLLNAVSAHDPAQGKMVLATMLALMDRTKADPVNGLRAILNSTNAYEAGGRDLAAKVAEAAQRGADKQIRSGAANAGTKVVDENSIETMSDDEIMRMTESLVGAV